MGDPVVSVVIATYNWSSALRYALRSVVAQTFTDFEVRVVGDGCTDDSAAVVASFDDPRLHWENLERNSGSQSLPNNRGVETARGEWIAYLGHDDLWHPRHLDQLLGAASSASVDVLHSLALIVHPDGRRSISGLFPGGAYGPEDMVVPSSMLHRRTLFERVGGWRNWREVSLPSDFEWQNRARLAGARFAAVERLSVVKLTSSLRKDSYLTRRSDEQAAWWERIRTEPDLPERELIEVLRGSLAGFDARIRAPLAIAHAPPGWIIEQLRWMRGLEPDLVPMEPLPADVGSADLPIAVSGCPRELAPETQTLVEFAVDNRTDRLVSSRLPHPVHLSYHWLDSAGGVVVADGLRSVLEPPLAPGERRTYSCLVRAPAREGHLRLRLALVQEGVRWFDDRAEADIAVVVRAPTAAG